MACLLHLLVVGRRYQPTLVGAPFIKESSMIFRNRKHAGELLAKELLKYKSMNPVVLALPRGGVPVAAEIAVALQAPLDILAVRKIGAPFHPEYALGAICEDQEPVWGKSILTRDGFNPDDLSSTIEEERNKILQQIKTFRHGRPLNDVGGRVVIVVDDGLATGATMSAAVKFLTAKSAEQIVIAVPIAAASSLRPLKKKVTEIIALEDRDDLISVGQWYDDFSQVTDDQVLHELQKTAHLKNLQSFSNSQDNIKTYHKAKPKLIFDSASDELLAKMKSTKNLDLLIDSIKDSRVVMLGESSHGTHEFYQMRNKISQRLIKEHGFKFIAVEGDWPDADRLHRYIQHGHGGSAKDVLMRNHRWPTWMWANQEIADLAEWLRDEKAGFYGLDIYSLFQSIDEVVKFFKKNDLQFANELQKKYNCFSPYKEDEISYARSLMMNPDGCQAEALYNLQKVLESRIDQLANSEDELFSAQQNARIVANAEAYYRSMLGGDASSWNVRDVHMMETLDHLLEKAGESAKCIVWAHNSHIGDYRATDMHSGGYINLGGLARQSYGDENVSLVGFGTYQGQVLASHAWGRQEQVMDLPRAKEGSYEDFFHKASVKTNLSQFFLLLDEKVQTTFAQRRGHRAVGVVYDPDREHGNYVPTDLAKRYDAFIYFDQTHALKSLHSIYVRGEFPDMWPSGV